MSTTLEKRVSQLEANMGEQSHQNGSPLPADLWRDLRRILPGGGRFPEESPRVCVNPALIMLLAQLRAAVDRRKTLSQ